MMYRLALAALVVAVGIGSITAVLSAPEKSNEEGIFGSDVLMNLEEAASAAPSGTSTGSSEGSGSSQGAVADAPLPNPSGTMEAPVSSLSQQGEVSATSASVIISPVDAFAPASDETVLWVSASTDRRDAVVLDGTAVAGSIYVFVTGPDGESAQFWLDDPEGKTDPFRTERIAPFDFAGGDFDTANPFDTRSLTEGSHSISALLTKSDGTTSFVTAYFEVESATSVESPTSTTSSSDTFDDGLSALAPVLLVSKDSYRTSPVALADSSQEGDIYVFLELGDTSAESVSFWLDQVSGAPFNVEKIAPYDLAGGSVDVAKPLDSSKLGAGLHSVTAKAKLADGSSLITSASFEVQEGTIESSTTTTTAETTTTTTAETTMTTTTTASAISGDVRFKPGDPVASVVSNSPNGTVFVFSPGVYTGVAIRPKSNQSFLGEAGAVLRGNGAAYAFRSGGASVTISGLVIEGYRPADRDAVIHAEGGARNWIIKDNEIHHNGEKGIKAFPGWQIIRNRIHHNGRYGVTGSGDGLVVADNEISYNSTDYGATGDSGGTKFVHTTNLVLRNNHVHHNYGNGLWVDINNVGALIEGNRLVGNDRAGVFIEISCGGTIRNNYAEGNGFGSQYPNWMAGSSAIQVADTPDVEIYNNTLVGNSKGIGGLQVEHNNLGAVTKCTPQLRNLHVHGNTITQSGGAAAGLDANNYQDLVWSSWNNRFVGNTYHLSDGARFRWRGDWATPAQWAAAGMS